MKRILTMMLALCLFPGTSLLFAGDDYDDMKAFLKETILIQEEYAASVERVNSAPELMAAVKALGERMEGAYAGRMRALANKYPGMNLDDPPLQLKAEIDRLNAVSERIKKLMNEDKRQYFDDPEVARLMQEMGEKFDRYSRQELNKEEEKK